MTQNLPSHLQDCVNALMAIECTRRTCQFVAKGLCRNFRFQKRAWRKVQVIKTKSTGWGLAAGELMEAGDFVMEVGFPRAAPSLLSRWPCETAARTLRAHSWLASSSTTVSANDACRNIARTGQMNFTCSTSAVRAAR